MTKRIGILGLWIMILCGNGLLAQSDDYQLVWSDEFEGTSVDLSKWEFQIGDGCPNLCGWGNNELEYYRSENAEVANGILTINVKQESFMGYAYTSTRMRTLGKQDWKYGKFEARIKLPKGQGIWPAFWLLPSDNFYGIWPNSGEIDVVELVGHEPEKIHGTIHFANQGGWASNIGGSYSLSNGDFSDDYHIYSVTWDTNTIEWFVDSVKYFGITRWAIHPANWPFDQPFHILLNCAVGGNWPGPPDATTVFPQQMQVDYVRVYQKDVPTGISNPESLQSLLRIFPNPAGNYVNLEYNGRNTQPVTVRLLDLTGRELHRDIFRESTRRSTLTIPTEYTPGVYLVQIETPEASFTEKLIISGN